MQIAIRNDVIIENIYIMGKIRLLLLLVLTIPCIARGQITIRQTAIVEKSRPSSGAFRQPGKYRSDRA